MSIFFLLSFDSLQQNRHCSLIDCVYVDFTYLHFSLCWDFLKLLQEATAFCTMPIVLSTMPCRGVRRRRGPSRPSDWPCYVRREVHVSSSVAVLILAQYALTRFM